MLKVYSSHNAVMFGILRDALGERGIEHLVKNEFLQGALGELPAMQCWPELWIVNDEDYTAAIRVLDSLNMGNEQHRLEPWHCEHCGEWMEGQFLACWQCSSGRYESRGAGQ